MAGDLDVVERARAEILARHRFFQDWFAGRCGKDALAAAMSAFAPGFCRVAPDGSLQTREQLYAALDRAADSQPATFTIEIDVEDIRVFRNGPVAARYVERQSGGGRPSARRASALFTATEEDTALLQWLSVHETWIEDSGA